ncbi:phosphoserine phosphatase [Thermoplasma volcanium GSS1]|uniref:phosphoserine phosphatase n=1 Tax=Thermoplasma volcanium (strain ATCC 51530 / DSM 4299 / JCM 9571 / NBRC 15438 / GSS1) TaxID=273116 RepID=Q979Q4_THEVO|nr:HAD-IB family phosphatase [Thermoplasma volcanium]BAB60248.1 phosphoserine phosphatase [Thermoplasma volcanium GSS1]
MIIDEISLFILDMDGTLTLEPSSWDYVHRRLGINNHSVTRLYRNRYINYYCFFQSDIKAWLHKYPNLKKEKVVEFLREVPIRHGADELINVLRKNGIRTAVISGGISWLFDIISERSKIDYNFSNEIFTDEYGYIVPEGKVRVIPEEKDLVVRKIQEELGIGKDQTASVGDEMENDRIHRYSKYRFIISKKARDNLIPIPSGDLEDLLRILE